MYFLITYLSVYCAIHIIILGVAFTLTKTFYLYFFYLFLNNVVEYASFIKLVRYVLRKLSLKYLQFSSTLICGLINGAKDLSSSTDNISSLSVATMFPKKKTRVQPPTNHGQAR